MMLLYLFLFIFLLGCVFGSIFIIFKIFPYSFISKLKKYIIKNKNKKRHEKRIKKLKNSTKNYEWKIVTNNSAWAPRDGAGAVIYKDDMYLIGGWNPYDKLNFPRITSNDVWKSSNGLTWIQIKRNSYIDKDFDSANDWEGRHIAGYIVYDDYIWIIGGDTIQGYHINDIWKTKDGINWILVNDGENIPWAPRALHSTFVFNNYIYVIGGQTMPKFTTQHQPNLDENYFRDIWRSKNGIYWEQVLTKGLLFSPRGGNTFIVFNNRIFSIGGFTYENIVTDKKNISTDIWSSSDAIEWTNHIEIADWARDGGFVFHNVVVFDNKLWIFGGFKNSKNTNEVWLSEDGFSWMQLSDVPLPKTHATALFSFDDRLFITSGFHMTSEVWILKKITSLVF